MVIGGSAGSLGVFTGGIGGLIVGSKSLLGWKTSTLSKEEINKEFRKVQQEVKQKMREADPLISDPDIL